MTDGLSLLRDLNYISRNLYRDRLREYPNGVFSEGVWSSAVFGEQSAEVPIV
jgi:hypothetical protein